MKDKRISYYMMIDTETANDLECPLFYDIGWAIVDKRGKVYETASYVNRDIFVYERELMRSSYYAEKIPEYVEALRNGERVMSNTETIRKELCNACQKWDVKAIIAHNMPFDYRATNTTLRWVTKSENRFFFPYGIPLWDTLRMSKDIICKQKTYIDFCNANDYTVKRGKSYAPRATAEILYRFITRDNDFIENHTGLEDVLIEKEIFAKCMAQHKPMRKNAFND